MTVIYATVRNLNKRVERVGHKLFMDNFVSFPALFDNLAIRKINFCGLI